MFSQWAQKDVSFLFFRIDLCQRYWKMFLADSCFLVHGYKSGDESRLIRIVLRLKGRKSHPHLKLIKVHLSKYFISYFRSEPDNCFLFSSLWDLKSKMNLKAKNKTSFKSKYSEKTWKIIVSLFIGHVLNFFKDLWITIPVYFR